MIVCICKNVNSRQVHECLRRGMSIEDMSDEMGLGTDCGSCLEQASKLAVASMKQSTSLKQNTSTRSARSFAPRMKAANTP